MKKLVFLFSLFFSAATFAQTNYNIPLKTKEECKAAEPAVLIAAGVVLSSPMNDEAGHAAQLFVMRWADNSEYTITIAGPISSYWKGKTNGNIPWIFAACQAKYIIEHPDKAKDTDAILLAAYNMLAEYVGKASNGVTITKNVQKLLDAKKNDAMAEYIKAK
jgi:hypothetical protein